MSASAQTAHEPDKLRRTVVWGAVNNLIFAVVGGALTFGQFVLVLRLVGPAQIGLYAMASVFATTIESISEFGIGDRLIQRDAEGFHESYSVAATAHFLLALGLWILILIAAPGIARFYRQPELWPLLSVMSYAAFAGVCRLPLSLLSREFKYFQQRLLMFIGKVIGFAVTVGMAYAGYGVWALVVGAMVTLAVTCVPAWALAHVRPHWRTDRGELRSLLNFSGPLWIGRMTMIAVQQGTILVLSLYLTTSEVGQYKAAEQIVFFLVSIDIILGQTIFPALCKVKDSPERIGIGFSKASRASMLWLAGVGGAMFVFPDSLVRFLLTSKWAGSEIFMRAQGLALIVGGIGS
ncbi:MAG: oligosaccharide flippase family protein, partial [Terriglobia bacterium]